MEVLRIEEPQKYGFLVKCGKFVKFFDDKIAGSKEKSLKCLQTYLSRAPKMYPNRPIFQTDEFKDFCKDFNKGFDSELTKFNNLRISSVNHRLKIKKGVKTSFWEITVIDQNKHHHVFDYLVDSFNTEQDAIDEFNRNHQLNLKYNG